MSRQDQSRTRRWKRFVVNTVVALGLLSITLLGAHFAFVQYGVPAMLLVFLLGIFAFSAAEHAPEVIR